MKIAAETELVEGRTVVLLGDSGSVFVVPRGGHIEIVDARETPDFDLDVKSYCDAGVQIGEPESFHES